MNVSEALNYLSSHKNFSFDSDFGGKICKPSMISQQVIVANVELQAALVALFSIKDRAVVGDYTIERKLASKDNAPYYKWTNNNIKSTTAVDELLAMIRPQEVSQVVTEEELSSF